MRSIGQNDNDCSEPSADGGIEAFQAQLISLVRLLARQAAREHIAHIRAAGNPKPTTGNRDDRR
jgi:hypothetical protein